MIPLSAIAARVGGARVGAEVPIERVTLDSRAAGPGVLFAAARGGRLDGHDFLPAAAAAGAAALVERADAVPDGMPAIVVADARRAAALAASAVHGDPADAMLCVGVTGTNGKTTTVAILRSILHVAGLRTGSIGTTGVGWEGRAGLAAHPATHTTPDGPTLWGWIAAMRADGVNAVALELSSHALHQGRAAGLPLQVGAWTNLGRDHLDYHGDTARYEGAKALLLTEHLPRWGRPAAVAVLFVDDRAVARHAGDFPRTWRVSAVPGAVERGEAEVAPRLPPELTRGGVQAIVSSPMGGLTLRSRLVGAHNLSNLLVAGASALAAGINVEAVENGWKTTDGAPGRLEPVRRPDGRGPLVLVDYAHTPDALAAVLAAVRPLAAGRVVTVFGCGGDRDAGKRAPMAAAAEAGSDEVYVTSDNPRSEDPEAILDQVQAGLTGRVRARREADRAAAIGAAIAAADADAVVLIAGKGHETWQEIGAERRPFDDRLVAAAALARWAP